MKAILIAGTSSGVGKTTIATGIMGAMHRRGIKVQPFKTGPDYIDPGYHASATSRVSRNLDTWMLSKGAVLELFHHAMTGKDMAVIEGVMGLYDGHAANDETGSTAELAKILGVPVFLILDSSKASRSHAAIVAGFRSFDPYLNIAGVILNEIGSERHLHLCKEPIEHYTGIPVVGYLPRRADLSIPERHLGLVPTAERPAAADFLDKLISQCEATLDIETILKISQSAELPRTVSTLFPEIKQTPVLSIGIARDRAFSFYYQDSLDILESWGCELVEFSPLSDTTLPEDISGLYIGGGFPEVYARQLAHNVSMKKSIAQAASRGMPIFAECGGLMYLCKSIRDLEGLEHTMAGVIPAGTQIDVPRLSLGYRTVCALNDNLLLKKGETARGHEFHWSQLSAGSMSPNAFKLTESQGKEGFIVNNTLASYIHLHMAAKPGMAQHFIEYCSSVKRSWG